MQRLALLLLWTAVARAGLPALTTTESSTTTSSTKTKSTTSTSSSSISTSETSSSSSSTSSTSSTSTSYTFTAEVPSEMSPWIETDSDTRGTVFIAVGAVLFAGLLLFGCWRAVCHLRSWRHAKQTDNEKMYQFNSGDAESSMFTAYDSSVFQKGGFSGSNSYFDGESTLGLDHRSVYSFQSNMDDVASQGRTLKNALTNNSTTINNVPRTRASYISPINEIMKQQLVVNLQPPLSAHSDSSFTFPPSSASTPRAIQQHDILAEHSFDFMASRQSLHGSPNVEQAKPMEQKKHKRPPSVVLDELLNDKFDL